MGCTEEWGALGGTLWFDKTQENEVHGVHWWASGKWGELENGVHKNLTATARVSSWFYHTTECSLGKWRDLRGRRALCRMCMYVYVCVCVCVRERECVCVCNTHTNSAKRARGRFVY